MQKRQHLWRINGLLLASFFLISIIGNPKIIVSSQTLNSPKPTYVAPLGGEPIIDKKVEDAKTDVILNQKIDSLNSSTEKITITPASKKTIDLILKNREVLKSQSRKLDATLNRIKYDSLVQSELPRVDYVIKADSIIIPVDTSSLALPVIDHNVLVKKKCWIKRVLGF